MIQVDSLLYKIDQKLNKLSTNEHQQIQLEDKLLVLNECQIILIKQKMDKMDATKKVYEDLQKLIEWPEEHPLRMTETDTQLHKWASDLAPLSPSYMFYVDSYLIADKGRCKNRKIFINKDLTAHGDLSMLLNNDHYKPSFEYQETFNMVSSDEIAIYTDGTFTPKMLYLSYLRYPKYIDKVGYIKLDGKTSVNQDCELSLYMEDELVDLTVQKLAKYTENMSAARNVQINE